MIREYRFNQWRQGAAGRLLVLFAVCSLAVAACAGDESTTADQGVAETDASDTTTDTGDDGESSTTEAEPEDADDGADTSDGEDEADDGEGDAPSELPNACPAEGCEVVITDAKADDSGEIQLTFDANYTPDFEQNHIHVFWDSQEPGSVSSAYEAAGFEVQGKWHPTDEYPTYLTQSDASVTSDSRGESTTVCVTAADTDHAVIDPGLFACRDVSDALS